MAEDFLPVGIRATVVGADQFVKDLSRMSRSLTTFSKRLGTTTTSMQALGTTAATSSAGVQKFGMSAEEMRQAYAGMTQALNKVGASIEKFTGRVAKQDAKVKDSRNIIIKLADGFEVALNKIKVASDSLASNTEKVIKNATGHQKLVESLAKSGAESDKLSAKLKKEEARHAELSAALEKEEQRLKEVRSTRSAATKEVVELQDKISKLKAALEKEEQAEKKNQNRIKQLRDELTILGDRYDEVRSSLGGFGAAANAASSRVDKARNALKEHAAAIIETKNKLSVLGSEHTNLQAKVLSLNSGIGILTGAIRAVGVAASVASATFRVLRVSISAVGTAISVPNKLFTQFIGKMKSLNDRVHKLGISMFRIGNSIRFLGTSMTFLISLPIIGFIKSMTQAAVDFEDAYAGVVRTVSDENFELIETGSNNIQNLTEQGERLAKSIRNLALVIPLPVTELAKLTELGGTLGIRGVANLEKFTEIAAKLGVTTNVSAEQAAVGLAKIIAISGGFSAAEMSIRGFSEGEISSMSKSENFRESLEGLGGVIVALGNKTRAQEDQILEFGEKIAASSNLVGISSKNVLAISSAFAAVGVDAARGGTAVQKALFEIEKSVATGGSELEVFAATAGLSVKEFSSLWEDDAAEAFRRFIEGLGQNKDVAIQILEEVGLADTRVAQSLLSVAGAEGELTRAMNIANGEIEAQAGGLNALQTEAERRFSTTQSQLTILKNKFTELGITMGSFLLPEINKIIGVVGNLIEKFTQLSDPIKKFVIYTGLAVAVIGPMVVAIGLILGIVGFVISAVTSFIGVILTLASTLGLLIIPIAAVIGAIGGLAIAFVASIGKMKKFGEKGLTGLTQDMFKFGRGIIIAFARGMATALIAIVKVLNAIGQIISHWLKPGSPPKLLPDLDKWGTEAMDTYMRGWTAGDFDIFNDIANKIESYIRSLGDTEPKSTMIEQILGARGAVAKATEEIRQFGKVSDSTMKRITKATAGASYEVRNYINSLVAVRLAAEKVKAAQEEVNAITEKYAKVLKPIEDRLKAISKRQQEVSNKQRIAELESILADPRSNDLARELARLEIEQINLQSQTSEIEDQRDIELERANAKLDAAKAEMEAAEESLKAAEALLDVQIKQNDLMNEMLESVKDLKDAIESIGAGDISGFDEDLLDTEGMGTDLENLFDDLDLESSIDEAIANINTSFDQLVQDILAEFAPLLGEDGLFAQLGDTWAPIFDRLLEWLDKFGPNIDGFLSRLDVWKSKTDDLASTVAGFVDGVLSEFFGILFDLGLMDPFGPLAEQRKHVEALGGDVKPFSKLGQAIEDVKQKILDFFESTSFGGYILGLFTGLVAGLTTAWDTLKGVLEPLKDAWENVTGALGDAIQIIRDTWNESSYLKDIILTLGRALGIIAGGALAIVIGLFVGLINGVARAIQFFSTFVGVVVEALATAFGGIIKFFEGIAQLIGGDFQGGLEKIWQGISEFISGIFVAIVGAVSGFVSTLLGMFFGFIEGVVEFFTNLYDKLVGNSIVPDLVNDIIDWFLDLVTKPIELLVGFVTDVVDKFIEIKDLVLETLGDLLSGAITWVGDLVSNIVDGIKNGILGRIGEVTDAIGGFFGSIKDKAKSVLGIDSPSKEFEDIGENTILGWKEGLESEMRDVYRMLDDFVDRMLDAVSQFFTLTMRGLSEFGRAMNEYVKNLLEAIFSHFGDFVQVMIRGMEDFFRAIMTMTVDFANDYSGGRGSIWYTIFENIVDMFTEFATGFVQAMRDLIDAFEVMVSGLSQIIEEQKEAMHNAGLALMDGLRAGLQAGAEAVYNTARQIAATVKDIINSALEISSPSKVFFEIGENIMKGWELGMESRSDNISSILDDTIAPFLRAQAASKQAPARLAAPMQAGPAMLPAMQAGSSTQVELNMGGQVLQRGVDIHTLSIALEQALKNVLR